MAKDDRKPSLPMKTRLQVLLWSIVVCSIGAWTGPAALAQGVADRFPDVNRVAADYQDDAERYVVLLQLWNVLHTKAPAATAKRSTYYRAAEGIRQKYFVRNDAAATSFQERIRSLPLDRDFERSVLEKYKLSNVTAEPTRQVPANADVTDAMIKGALVKSSPFWLGGLLAMVMLVRIRVRSASTLSTVGPPPASVAGGLPMLPESLRVISVPLLQYCVRTDSVIAFDKETTLHTSALTTTTGGEVYTVGNQVHSTPVQSTTAVGTTQKDLIWVRTAERHETSWTFTGGTFKVRPGHIISAISPEGGSGRPDFMMVYNHNTGQLETFSYPHGARGGGAWLLATLVGSVGFAITVAMLVNLQPNPEASAASRIIAPVAYWVMGVIPAAIIALALDSRVRLKLYRQRNADFAARYLPQFRQFLEQSTPALQKHFNAA